MHPADVPSHISEPEKEHPCVTLICCPFRCACNCVVCAVFCLCCPFLLCFGTACAACILSCVPLSLRQAEQLYRLPLWVVVLKQNDKLTDSTYSTCSSIFSHPDFEHQTKRNFDIVDRDGSGVIDQSETEHLIRHLSDSFGGTTVGLSDSDQRSVLELYKRFTGRATSINRDDFAIFCKCIFALMIANAMLEREMDKEEIVVAGIDAFGKRSDRVEITMMSGDTVGSDSKLLLTDDSQA